MDNDWVAALLERYRQVQQHVNASAALTDNLNTLQLADALQDKSQLVTTHPDHPLQISIIGPTQAGKSSLVNVLLDSSTAGISALAGFTIHAQGYASGCSAAELDSLESVMAPLIRTPATELEPDRLDTFSLENVAAGNRCMVPAGVVWDSPDFDSIASGTYRRAVLCTVAIADVLLLVLSKDKYGDKSAWDMLALLHTLGKPVIIVINKLDATDEDTVLHALHTRHLQKFGNESPPVVVLPFFRSTNADVPLALTAAQRSALYSALQNAIAEVSRSEQDDVVNRFIRRHVSDWLAPLRDERKAAYDWQQLLNDAVQVAKYDYAKGYLNNPDKYDTFNRALAELLTLLEIPGLANSLARTRALVTWPARKLLGVGRSVLAGSVTLATGMGKGSKLRIPDQEADTLVRILDKSLTHLQTQLLEKADNPAQQALWWRSLNHSFRQREPLIRQAFTRESERARAEFEPRIEAAAHQLYKQLQSQPTLLNTLRATRVTADAAGIALALKSGGLAPADLILAPAMLSVTTLLTESALGRYMDLIKNELKQEQQKHINARLLDGLLTTELEAVARHLSDDGLFTTNLDPSIKRALDDMRTQEASSFV